MADSAGAYNGRTPLEVDVRVLVLGGEGMLGHKVYQAFRARHDTRVTFRQAPERWLQHPLYEGASAWPSPVDARRFETVASAVNGVKPHVVVNCVGIVKQLAEAHDAVISIEVNSLFPHRLAELCLAAGSRLIHMSTDCVFNGAKGGYRETALADADDLYGRSKRLGEVAGPGALTFRTSIIGRELERSGSLLEWFLGTAGRTITGYRRAIFTGFPTIAFAGIIADVVEHHPGLTGLYHVAAPRIDKYELLLRLKEAFRVPVTIEPADEPFCDRSLDGSRFSEATGFEVPSWDELIGRLAADPTPYEDWRQFDGTARG
jgi:dTDP-4-dehydrorhamnose reductase